MSDQIGVGLAAVGLFFYLLVIYRSWLARRSLGRWPWLWSAQSPLEAQARRSLWAGYVFLHLFVGLYLIAPATVQQIFSSFLPWQAYGLRFSAGVSLGFCAGFWFWLTWRMGPAWHIGINPHVTQQDYRPLALWHGRVPHPIYVLLTLMTTLVAIILPLWLLLPVVFLCGRGWYLQARAEDAFWQVVTP